MTRSLFFVVVVSGILAICLSEESSGIGGLTPAVKITADSEGVQEKRSLEYYSAPANWPENGVPGENKYPSYEERSMGTWINVVRIGWRWYRDTYLCPLVSDSTCSNVFATSSFASTEPGFWNFNLNRAARGHCTDVLANPTYFNNGGGHNDANGSSFSARFQRFESISGSAGEIYINEAPGSGLFRGFMSVAGWVCDGMHYLGGTIASLISCPVDSSAGHRDNIMTISNQFGCGVDGIGHTLHADWGTYTTTCDMMSSRTTKYSSKHIAMAAHVGDPSATSKFMYLATIYTKDITVSSMKVIESSTEGTNTITMSLLRSGTNGAVYSSASYASLSSCRSYYFELKYGSTTERYPTTGYFYTYGMSCTTDWKSTGISPTVQCTSGACCDTSTGKYRANTYVCRAKDGACDVAEKCTGSSATCPTDGYASSSTVCSSASGPCENDAKCTGSSKTCPSKTYKSSSTVCNASSGACENDAKCSGSSATCPSKTFKASGTVCNAATGTCENDAKCTGKSAACPSKTYKSSSTVCNAASGPCENDAKCSGSSGTCPSKTYKSSGTVCNAASGVCENAGKCTGSSATCPSKSFKSSTTVCRAKNGTCDAEEYCTGSSAACPTDKYASKGTVCSTASGPCENNATCSGSSASCPSKTFKSSSTVCRAKNGACDVEEKCTGSSAACPADTFVEAGTVCNKSSGPCEDDAVCSGSSKACPAKKAKSKGTVCREAVGMCDAVEVCNGSSILCPSDEFLANGTPCDNATANCTGKSAYCPTEPIPVKSVSSTKGSSGSDTEADSTVWIAIVASVCGAALIAGAVILAIVLVKRNKKKDEGPSSVALESVQSKPPAPAPASAAAAGGAAFGGAAVGAGLYAAAPAPKPAPVAASRPHPAPAPRASPAAPARSRPAPPPPARSNPAPAPRGRPAPPPPRGGPAPPPRGAPAPPPRGRPAPPPPRGKPSYL